LILVFWKLIYLSKPSQYEFFHELSCNCRNVSVQSFHLHSFSGIICIHMYIFVLYESSSWFDWANKIESPFHEWFLISVITNFARLCDTSILVHWQASQNFVKTSSILEQCWPPISCMKNLFSYYVCCKMASYNTFMKFSKNDLCFFLIISQLHSLISCPD
jgi:hypothetical protein